MLFISRYVGDDKVGIFDTDDNTEEIIHRVDALELAGKYGIKVCGISTDSVESSFGTIEYGTSIAPYQLESTIKPIQTKALLLYNIKVTMFGSMITSIQFEENDIDEPVTLRLSDFGSSCADCILLGNSYSKRHLVTLLLDDNIDFGPYTFACGAWGVTKRGVRFDLRELVNSSKAKNIYGTLMKSAARSETYKSVIDSDERKLAIRLGQ